MSLADIQNVYRSQRSNFTLLILSSILFAFIINIMSEILYDIIPIEIISIIAMLSLFMTLYYGFDTPLAIHKSIKIPLIFKIENNKLKVISIIGYRV